MIDFINFARSVIEIESDALEKGSQNLNQDFNFAVNAIIGLNTYGRVVVLGVGKSGHVGQKIAATLASTGTPSIFIHPSEAGHGDLGMITKHDIVLAISQSGNAEELCKLFPYFVRYKIPVIAFTGNKSSELAEFSQFVIDTSVEKEACPLGLAPTSSTTLAMVLGDALAACLMKKRGFSESDFASTHPLGSLGKQLFIRVHNLMIGSKHAAFISPETSVYEAIIAMTAGELGFLAVIDDNRNVIGVFTDGDLRRCLEAGKDINYLKIHDVMNVYFIAVQGSVLAVQAVELMSENKISQLPVVDESGKFIGSINMRILLQAGIV